MKTVEEIKAIALEYTSGPVVHIALEDAIKWIEAYRRVAIQTHIDLVRQFQELGMPTDQWVDAEARRLVEGKGNTKNPKESQKDN